MKKITIFVPVVLVIFLLLGGCAEKPVSLDLTAEYVINAALEPEEKRLTYTQEVTVTNCSDESVDELYFHLYGNYYATKDERISVLSVTDGDGGKLSYKLSDGDQLCRVKLGRPLTAGGEAILCFSCDVTIPVLTHMYGVGRDGEIQMPFFYPQLAVCDENGWDKDPLNGVVDGRYAEMADYTLVIAAPEEYELAANGAEISRVTENGLTTYTFEAERRRDLIFIAWNNYERMERTIGNTRILGCFSSERTTQEDMEKVMDAAVFALEFFNETYVEYPYETLVMTTTAWATKSMPISMEYSGFVTLARGCEEYAVFHELAHQWFYFLIGNDENAEPWLDESFADYSAMLCAEHFGLDMSNVLEVYSMMSDDSSGFSLDSAYDEPDYASALDLFYARGMFFLRELETAIGQESFLELLSGYCNKYLFHNVTTEDFFSYLREQSAVDVEEIIGRYFWK
ncbi:MAG: M1 family metallopeptidase [Butyricicoccus sp.]|nr:M1 family metallopeptidase [Butyricicoccus sp.]